MLQPSFKAYVVAAALAALVLCNGCFTWVGLGIGAFTERTETVPPGTLPNAEQCRDVRIEYTTPNGETARVDATLLEAHENVFRLQLDYGPIVTSDWSNVTKISCRRGNYAILGMIIGAAADILIVVVVASQVTLPPLG